MTLGLKNLATSGKYMVPLIVCAVLLSGFRSATFTLEHLQAGGPPIANTLLVAWLTGSVIGPLLLTWLPGRGLAMKGIMAGLLGLLIYPAFCFSLHLEPLDVLTAILVIPALTSLLMRSHASRFAPILLKNETEMKTMVPIQLALVAMAAGIWIAARFI